ncbi:MAG: EamA family transporter [Pseudomonadota bacterium]
MSDDRRAARSMPDNESVAANMLGAIPPPGLVLLAIVAIQLGAAFATNLFPVIGADGAVAVRIIFAAILLLIVSRTGIRQTTRIFAQNRMLLLMFGLCLAAMNMFFYQSIARIPLGAAVAIEFIGPLGVAAFNSRRVSHFGWVALAAAGIALLSPLSGIDLDPIGILFAVLAGTGWALFIILSTRVSSRIPGHDGLAIGMTVAACAMIPFAIPALPAMVNDPLIIFVGIGVALLSTSIPFTLEFEALKKITKRMYGVLVSVEPAVAALIGAVILGERMGIQGMIAVACVVAAAAGITATDKHE